MRIFAVSVLLLMAGCASQADRTMYSRNMLDTAPKGDFEVLYPEWGQSEKSTPTTVQAGAGKISVTNYDALQRFLMENGIDYEVVPGEHMMVKVKDSVKFATGSSKMSPDSQSWLNKMGHFLANERGIEVVVDGYTDNAGQSAFNEILSMQRAQTVKQALIKTQLTKDSVYTRAYGENLPACSNQTTQGRACNRRVELFFILSNN